MRKILRIVLTLLGCCIACVAIAGLGLILVPGATILGVRYVGVFQESYNGEQILLGDLSGNIIIDTKEVPVEIVYSSTSEAYIKYNQSFIGFTTTPQLVEEYVVVTEKKDGYHITFNDYDGVFASSNRHGVGVVIVLPASYTKGDLSVVSKASSVSFSGDRVSANTVNVSTMGNVVFNNKIIEANSVNIENASVVVNSKLMPDSNLTVSTTKSISVMSDNAQSNYNLTTTKGRVIVGSCNNLDIVTTSGKVFAASDNAVVCGNANLQTSTGSITLAMLNGKSNINSKYGAVNVKYASNIDVNNSYGATNIECANNAEVVSKTGNIKIGEVQGSIDIESISGDVALSSIDDQTGATKFVNNAKVFSGSGSVTAYNLTGKRGIISTKKGDINVKCSDVGNLKLLSEKGAVLCSDISAIGTTIDTLGAINVAFLELNGNVKISGGNKAVVVSVPKDADYDCVVRTQNDSAKLNVGGLEATGVSFSTSVSDDKDGYLKTITISTIKGNVCVK